MYSLTQLKQALFLIVLVVFGLLPVQAVVPPPDGCYPNLTTAEGCNALFSLATGQGNTALGHDALFSDTSGSWNTGVGAVALAFNNGDFNTAVGVAGLLLNDTGGNNTAVGAAALLFNNSGEANTATGAFALYNNTSGTNNTAMGTEALRSNMTGSANTAVGDAALFSNTTSDDNTAIGTAALFSNGNGRNTAVGRAALFANTTGANNTATGWEALLSNTEGSSNTADGWTALGSNTDGNSNTAVGLNALGGNTSGDSNTAVGVQALANNSSGDHNTSIGRGAGVSVTGSGNVCIGYGVDGNAAVNDTTWIRNVNTLTQNFSAGVNDYVTVRLSDGRLGHTAVVSSQRYKHDIKPLAATSKLLYELKPVSFRLKKEYDPTQVLGFGLIAEEVEKVNGDLVYRNDKGQVESVRYEMVNAMLLNEFLKEHKTVKEQGVTIARLQKQIEALTAGLQKVSAQLELNKPAPQTVLNNR